MTSRPRQRLRRAAALGSLALITFGFAPALATAAKNAETEPLVGTWRLIRYADTPEGGAAVEAFGAQPIGLFIFTADGHVSISIMRNPPDIAAATTDPDPEACVPGWYCSYFGTYRVDHAKGAWVTLVEGGNIPAYLGTAQRRVFKIEGDRLVIAESYVADGKPVRAERVLVREPAAPR